MIKKISRGNTKTQRKMKDSGVEWLGKIPEEWKVIRLGKIGNFKNGVNKPKEAYGSGLRFVTVKNLYDEGFINQENLDRVMIEEKELQIYGLQKHDILITRSSVDPEGVGYPAIIGSLLEQTVFSGFVIRFRVSLSNVYKPFLYRVASSMNVRGIVVASANTVAQSNISQPALKSIHIALPVFNEQKSIALFLDRETEKIDALIEKKERQMELLQEKRSTLISHAVTKGINPNVQMKDSGIEWLGNIPEHWEVKKLKHISSAKFSNVDKHTTEGELPVRLCNYVDVYYNDYITGEMEFMKATATPTEIAKFTLKEGDIIITKDSEAWDDIAIPAYVSSDFEGVLCGYHLAQIRPKLETVYGKFLFRSFSGNAINDQFKIAATGVTRFGLGKYWLDNSIFPVPPISKEPRASARGIKNLNPFA